MAKSAVQGHGLVTNQRCRPLRVLSESLSVPLWVLQDDHPLLNKGVEEGCCTCRNGPYPLKGMGGGGNPVPLHACSVARMGWRGDREFIRSKLALFRHALKDRDRLDKGVCTHFTSIFGVTKDGFHLWKL